MKSIFRILILLLLNTFILAHEQHVHQYLTVEAYYLLKQFLGYDIDEMLLHLNDGPVSGKWTNGTIASGAWLEDEEDIVYHLRDFIEPFFDEALISITHFWDADEGDFTQNTFRVNWEGLGGSLNADIGPYPNAYEKIMNFAYPNYSWEIKYELSNYGLWSFNSISGETVTITADQIGIKYQKLTELYKDKIAIISGYDQLGTWQNCNYEVYLPDEYIDFIVWEILGRMCHLLQDMSVPAHAHRDEHGMVPDPFEDHMGELEHYTFWNSSNIGNSIINPLNSSNPIHFLMYTTQQIADHFGSRGPYEGVGDGADGDNLGGNPLTEELVFFQWGGETNLLQTLGEPTYMASAYSDAEIENMRDKTIPHVIKATAGLLYWFALEAKLIVDVAFKNNFNAGILQLDNNTIDSGTSIKLNVSSNHVISAIEPQQPGLSHFIWNDTESPSAVISEWKKYDEFNNPQTINDNQNQTYYLNVQSDDADATYVADMKEAHKVDKNYDTEFQGIVSTDQKYMVKYSSGNIIADQWIYPNGYPLVFGGWGDQIVPNNSRSRPINNINQDLEVNANYKYLQHASSSAFISPGQRRFAKTNTSNGELIDMVYESGGNVWYEYSVDGGLHWNVYQVGIDGAKNPVLAHEGNYGIVVYQQESKLRMAIFDYQFSSGTWSVSRWDSGDIDDFGTTYLIYPAVTAHNSKLLISYRNSDGLYYAFGNFFTGTYYEYRKGFISGTSANCRYSSIEVDKSSANFKVHLVYEYAPSVNYTKVFWKTLENTSGITILQSAPEEVSIGSGYSWNEKPVIAVMDNGTPRVVWQGGIDAIEKVSFGFQQQSRTYRTCLRARDGNGNNWYPTIWKFGSDTKYGSIQRSSDNNYIIGWLEGTNVKYARNNDYYVRDSGMDGYGLQIASGASTRNDITFSSVSDGNEPRWFVYTDGLGKENTITPFYGREGAVSINSIDYYFVLADIFHNNTAIDFVELEEDDFISNFTQLNAKLESEPFEISSGDELYFSILYGLTAFEEEDVDLSETDFIDFKVELVDVGNNSILGTFDHISYTSDNYALYKDIAYSVNTDGIGDKTVKLRLVVNSSETGKFALSSINSDSQILYKPSSPQEIYFSGDPNIVEEYSLLNCYPNPFNPATNIEFNVKEAGFVDLRIYNILGEEITKLVNKKMAPGKHTVVFNAEHLPSGVYIYKLSVNEFVESKKMILTK